MLGTNKAVNALKKLEIGSGAKPKSGYLHFDVRANVKADVIGDARQLPFSDNEFNEVYSRFFLEHMPRLDAKKALMEMLRVIKPKGTIEIIVPNLAYFCRLYLEETGQKKQWALNKMYGFENYSEDHHFFGYDYDTLETALKETGFVHVEFVKDEEQYLHVKAQKP